MRYRVQMSDPAKDDLSGIISYISESLCNRPAAERLFEDFAAEMRSLAVQPSRYQALPLSPWREQGYHVRPVRNYLLVYHIDGKSRVVTVSRIFHSLQDWLSRLDSMS